MVEGTMSRRWVSAWVLALAFAMFASPARCADRVFLSGYAGSLPAAPQDRAKTYFKRPQVRAVIFALERGPLTRARAERMLAGSDADVDDLLRLKLVRADGQNLRLGFSYFTAGDMRLIHAAAARQVASLVAAYLADKPRLDAIWKGYDPPGVDKRKLAFVLIAGLDLNWDALDLLEEAGYRKPLLVAGKGWQYSFWASENVPGYSYKAYFWGSSTFPAAGFNFTASPLDYSFSSFGDPSSDPRMNLPDLLSLPADQLTPKVRAAAQALGFHDDDHFGLGLKNVVGLDRARDLGALLFALRAGPKTKVELARVLGRDGVARLAAELGLLRAIDYAAPGEDGRWRLTVPVLDRRDAPLVRSVVAENRRILRAWLAAHYGALRGELSGLTAVRQGVPYEALFTQIWHDLFGLTTRELVARGLLADPYDAHNPAPGSLSMLWRMALYQHRWQ
jgi:hypothetical protein